MRYFRPKNTNTPLSMDDTFKIPGLDWDDLSITESRKKQNFVSQELSRYKSKQDYLARLIHQKLTPVPVKNFNPHDPCDSVKMLKAEWNDKDVTQQNGHYNNPALKNFSQGGFSAINFV